MVYIFLRSFGDNKFEVPVYYQEGILIEGCAKRADTVHLVNLKSYNFKEAQLFYFPQWVNDKEFYRQCERIKTKPYRIMFTAISDTVFNTKLGNTLRVENEEHLYKVANCVLVFGQEVAITNPVYNQLVLVDSEKRIRGYFNGNNLEDMDRLDIELDILNNEHE